MNKPVFKKEDFTLCDVPVPRGYPQSQTHSGIALHDGNYYLTTSPYPERKLSRWQFYPRYLVRRLSKGLLFPHGEFYENPCLYIGVKENDEDIPVFFRPIKPFPLSATPPSKYGLPAYNSDPDILIDGDSVYIMNRAVFRKKPKNGQEQFRTEVYLMTGIAKSSGIETDHFSCIKTWDSDCCISPCLTKYKGHFLFMYLDSQSAIDAETFGGLFLQKMQDIDEIRDNTRYCRVNVFSSDYLPWHMSLFQYNGKLYSIVACVKRGDESRSVWQMLGLFSDDLSDFTIFPRPLTDYNSYRGSACVRSDGMFILYSTTVYENIPGSSAVDGRNVIVAHKTFDEVLKAVSKT